MARTPAGRPRDPDVDHRIDEATRALLREGGIGAVTVTAVAKRAEVGRPTVYRRYPDALDLLRAVLLHDLDRTAAEVFAAPPPPGPLQERLLTLVRPFLRYYRSDPALSRTLLGIGLVATDEWARRFGDSGTRFMVAAAAVIEESKRDGEVGPDANSVLAAGVYFALYLSTVLGGLNGLLPTLEEQEMVLTATFAQHIEGLRGHGPAQR